jgi:hypothetical protein
METTTGAMQADILLGRNVNQISVLDVTMPFSPMPLLNFVAEL